jgi:pimeloyl-ACP methyl ester carboxylesterase
MYSVQQPLSTSAFGEVMGTPAWRGMRTWYAVAQNDEAIPPDVERQFAERMDATVIEIASGHVAMVSHPDEVADVVRTAARSVLS